MNLLSGVLSIGNDAGPAIEKCLKLMKLYADMGDYEGEIQCAKELRTFATQAHSNTVYIYEHGGIPRLVTLAARPKARDEARIHAVRAITAMSHTHHLSRKQCFELGLLTTLVSMLQMTTKKPKKKKKGDKKADEPSHAMPTGVGFDLQKVATACLAVLTSSDGQKEVPEHALIIRKQCADPKLVGALVDIGLSMNVDAFLSVAKTLEHLASIPAVQKMLFEDDGIGALVHMSGTGTSDVRVAASSALGSLITSSFQQGTHEGPAQRIVDAGGLPVILSCLLHWNTDVQLHALATLHLLLSAYANMHTTFISEGGLTSIVQIISGEKVKGSGGSSSKQAMALGPNFNGSSDTSESMRHLALGMLVQLTEQMESNGPALVNANALQLLVRVVAQEVATATQARAWQWSGKFAKWSKEDQVDAMRGLANMLSDAQSQSIFMDAGYVPLFFDCMKKTMAFSSSSSVNVTFEELLREHIARALSNLSMSTYNHCAILGLDESATNFSLVGKRLNGLLFLLQSQSTLTRRYIVKAFSQMAQNASQTSAALTRGKCIQMLIQLTKSNSSDPEIQKYAIITLSHMAFMNEENAHVRIVQEGGLRALVAFGYSKNPSLQEQAASALSNMTLNCKLEAQLIDDGGLQLLDKLSHSKRHWRVAYLASMALSNYRASRTLGKIAVNAQMYQMKCLQHDAVDSISTNVSADSSQDGVLSSQLQFDPADLTQLCDGMVSPSVEVQRITCLAITHLAQTTKQRALLAQAGVLDVLPTLIVQQSEKPLSLPDDVSSSWTQFMPHLIDQHAHMASLLAQAAMIQGDPHLTRTLLQQHNEIMPAILSLATATIPTFPSPPIHVEEWKRTTASVCAAACNLLRIIGTTLPVVVTSFLFDEEGPKRSSVISEGGISGPRNSVGRFRSSSASSHGFDMTIRAKEPQNTPQLVRRPSVVAFVGHSSLALVHYLRERQYPAIIIAVCHLFATLCQNAHDAERFVVQGGVLEPLVALSVMEEKNTANSTSPFAIVRASLHTLTRLCLFEGNHRLIMERLRLPVLMSLMRASDMGIQIHAASIIEAVLSSHRAYQSEFIEADGLQPLIQMLSSMVPQTQICASHTLAALCTVNPLIREHIKRFNVIGELSRMAQSTSDDLRHASAELLSNLVVDLESDENANSHASGTFELSLSMDGLLALIALIHTGDGPFSCKAASALAAIASRYEGKIQIAKYGGIPALLDLARSSRHEAQHPAILTLNRLSTIAKNQTAIVDEGGLQILLTLVSSPDTKIEELSIMTLANIAVNAENEKKIVSIGGQQWLRNLAQSADRPEIQREAVRAMNNLEASKTFAKLANYATWRLQPVQPGEIQQMVLLLKENQNTALEREVARALGNVGCKSSNLETIYKEEGMAAVVNLCDSPDEEVQGEAARAVGNFALNSVYCPHLIELGAIELLANLLESANPHVHGEAAHAMGNLAQHVDSHLRIARAHAIHPLIVLLARSSDPTIQYEAARALAAL